MKKIKQEESRQITSSLPQAGCDSYDTLCGTASFGSRPSLCDAPACGKPLLVS